MQYVLFETGKHFMNDPATVNEKKLKLHLVILRHVLLLSSSQLTYFLCDLILIIDCV